MNKSKRDFLKGLLGTIGGAILLFVAMLFGGFSCDKDNPTEPKKGVKLTGPRVDPDLCTACELCVDKCPDIFAMGQDVAYVKVDTIPSDSEACFDEAMKACPAKAIKK